MKEVVVYTSVDDVFARPITSKFEKQTGIKVKLVTDVEETKGTGLINRLIAEKKRPRADVFWSGDPIRAAILKSKGISQPYFSSIAKNLPKLYSDPEGYWTGFSVRARIILYNKNLINNDDKPKSIMDFLKAKYKGKVCFANPLFGTTSMHASALFDRLGDKKGRAFFINMRKNDVKMVSSNGEVRRRVSEGDCVLGVTDTDDAYTALREGKNVGIVFPDQDGMGTLIIPNAIVLIANAPHLKYGKQFIDFLLQPETEKMLAQSEAAQIPVRSDIKGPDIFPGLNEIKPMNVNYEKLSSRLEQLSKGFLLEWSRNQ